MTDQHERWHILFVDDELAAQRLVERLLRSGLPGVRVTCASDGAEALAVLASEPVHLLIMDLEMPGLDGAALMRRLSHLCLMLPVMVVTGHASSPHEALALATGAVECYEKPIQAEPFLEAVRALLDTAEHRSRIEGISLAGFVQLLHMERKTCALWVSIPGALGALFFHAGALVDARQADHGGAAAALEILTWRDPVITLEAQSRGRAATIHVGITELLLESARLADERERNARRRGRPAAVAAPARPLPAERPPATAGAIGLLLTEVMKLEGAAGAAVANWSLDHSLSLPDASEARPIESMMAGNCRLMRALMSAMARLGLAGRVQNILITLDEQSHIIWPLPRHEGLFLYLAINHARSNLALTRLRLQKIVDAQSL